MAFIQKRNPTPRARPTKIAEDTKYFPRCSTGCSRVSGGAIVSKIDLILPTHQNGCRYTLTMTHAEAEALRDSVAMGIVQLQACIDRMAKDESRRSEFYFPPSDKTP